MAFDIQYLAKVSSSGNQQGLNVWSYNGSSSGSNETAATIVASAYFNNLQQRLTATAAGPLQVSDVMYIHGNDASGMYLVTSITTNVTLATFAAIGTVNSAQLADNLVNYVRLTPSLAEFIAGNTTPMPLVAAQGAGTMIVPHRVQLSVDYGGTVLAAGGTLQLAYGVADVAATVASNTLAAATIIAATADTTFGFSPIDTTLVDAGKLNIALNLSVDTADFTGGTASAYIVDVWYSVVDLS